MASGNYPLSLKDLESALSNGNLPAAGKAVQELIGYAPSLPELGSAIGDLLLRQYAGLRIEVVGQFVSWLRQHPAEDMSSPAIEVLEPRLKRALEWADFFAEVAAERQARDLRSAIQTREEKQALRICVAILQAETSEKKDLIRRAKRLGTILGSLDNQSHRVEKIVGALLAQANSLGLDDESINALNATIQETRTGQMRTDLAQAERQWTQLHTQAVVDLMRELPGSAAGNTARPEDEERFLRALQDFWAGYFARPDKVAFLDVARIIHEFCPTDPRAYQLIEGIQEVAFLTMNPVDRLTAVRALRRLGEAERLVRQVADTAKQARGDREQDILLGLMGGLSSPAFVPYLADALHNKKFTHLTPAIIDALGRVGDDRSLSTLQNLLSQCCRERLIDPPLQRRIDRTLSALGRIARHPRTTPRQRDEIVTQALKTIPRDRSLARSVLLNLFDYNPSALSPEVRKNGVALLVDALWLPHQQTRMDKGDVNQRTELGGREPLAEILQRMGKESIPILLEAAEPRAMQYSGAYWALGEVFAKTGDERVLPIIEKMVSNALVTDEEKLPDQLRENYFDAARNEYVPLTRDKIIHSLLYAVRNSCGKSGAAYLRNLAQQIQSGRFEMPGGQTADLISEFYVQDKLQREALEREAEREDSTDENPLALPEGDLDELFEEIPRRPREAEPLERLLKEIRGKGIFRPKPEKRITAIQEVGARHSQEAIGVLCRALGEGNVLLRAASETALLEILQSGSSPVVYRAMVFELLQALREASPEALKPMTEIFLRLHPERDPLKAILLKTVDTESDATMKQRIAMIFQAAREKAGERKAIARTEYQPESPEADEEAGPHEPTAQEKLVLRRQYYAERKRWIAEGKRGPEPVPPPGL